MEKGIIDLVYENGDAIYYRLADKLGKERILINPKTRRLQKLRKMQTDNGMSRTLHSTDSICKSQNNRR